MKKISLLLLAIFLTATSVFSEQSCTISCEKKQASCTATGSMAFCKITDYYRSMLTEKKFPTKFKCDALVKNNEVQAQPTFKTIETICDCDLGCVTTTISDTNRFDDELRDFQNAITTHSSRN